MYSNKPLSDLSKSTWDGREPCDDCDSTRLVWESCACNDCEYDAKHSQWVTCATCLLPSSPEEFAALVKAATGR